MMTTEFLFGLFLMMAGGSLVLLIQSYRAWKRERDAERRMRERIAQHIYSMRAPGLPRSMARIKRDQTAAVRRGIERVGGKTN